MTKTSIVIVSWNSGEDLIECVASLARSRGGCGAPESLELVVLDNHSDRFPEARIRGLWPDARLAALEENVGFGPAANHGAAHARGEILLFLNPDTRAEGNPFPPIAAAFESHPDWVAVAPRLLDPDSGPHHEARGRETQEEFQLRRLPRFSSALRELLLVDRLFPGNRWRRRDRYLDRDRERPFEVEQPAAAALAVRASAFRRLGGFDPRFAPAWWEDVDLCRRLATLGKIVYVPAARFEHAGRRSLELLGYDRFLPIYYRNAISYWEKSSGRITALAYRLLVIGGMLLRIAILPLRRDDPRPKPISFRAYASTLAAALARPRRTPGS